MLPSASKAMHTFKCGKFKLEKITDLQQSEGRREKGRSKKCPWSIRDKLFGGQNKGNAMKHRKTEK